MADYEKKCNPPIPIGVQRFAYQCENVFIEPIHGQCSIRAYPPFKGGKEPYPNSEASAIEFYNLEIRKFTQNAIEVHFVKKFKDKSEEIFLTNVSFSDFVNRIFADHPANHWFNESPNKEHL